MALRYQEAEELSLRKTKEPSPCVHMHLDKYI